MKIEIEVTDTELVGLSHVCNQANVERHAQQDAGLKQEALDASFKARQSQFEKLSNERAPLFSLDKPTEADLKKLEELNNAIRDLKAEAEDDAKLLAEAAIAELDETPEAYLVRIVKSALESYGKQERELRVRAAVEASM